MKRHKTVKELYSPRFDDAIEYVEIKATQNTTQKQKKIECDITSPNVGPMSFQDNDINVKF